MYQYDQYRQIVNEYKSARSRYLKYKTLASQTDALDKTKQMLSQRDELLLAYISLLKEKISENRGLPAAEKEVSLSSLIGSTQFLETNKRKIPMLSNLDDATTLSADFEAQYSSKVSFVLILIIGLCVGGGIIAMKSFTKHASILSRITPTLSVASPKLQTFSKIATMDAFVAIEQTVASLSAMIPNAPAEDLTLIPPVVELHVDFTNE